MPRPGSLRKPIELLKKQAKKKEAEWNKAKTDRTNAQQQVRKTESHIRYAFNYEPVPILNPDRRDESVLDFQAARKKEQKTTRAEQSTETKARHAEYMVLDAQKLRSSVVGKAVRIITGGEKLWSRTRKIKTKRKKNTRS